MFAKSFIAAALLALSSSEVLSKPILYTAGLARRAAPSPGPAPSSSAAPSFNNYDGISTMSNFDNFYGSGDFSGSQTSQTVIVQKDEVVCHSVQVEIIQQKLVILQEMAKRIVTEQICEVEVQTIVIQQFQSSMESFSGDLSRQSGKQVGYDSNIAGKIGQVTNSDGSLSSSDLGFNGSSVGSSSVVPTGNNWNDASSPASVQKAMNATLVAHSQ